MVPGCGDIVATPILPLLAVSALQVDLETPFAGAVVETPDVVDAFPGTCLVERRQKPILGGIEAKPEWQL